MSASKGTFSYAQAAKGLATSSSHSTKPTPPLPSTTEQKHSATPDSRRDSSQHDKGPHSSAMVESRLQKDVDSAEITKAGATVPEKDTSAPMNGMSPPASPEFGMSSTSTLVKEDDQSSAQPTSSDTTWDNKSTTSINGEQNLDQTEVSAEKGKSKDSRNGSEAEIESIQHNAMHDAPPPVENVWKKRAEARAAVQPIRPPTQTPKKMSGINSESADHAPELPSSGDRRRSAGPTTAVDEEHSKPSSRERKSNASPSARNQSEQGSGHRRRDQRSAEGRKGASSTRTSSRDEKVVSSPPLPPGRDEESWPTPETAEKEEKKKVQEKSEKPEKTEEDVPEKKKAHGKSAWKSVPFTPTVVFNTPLPSSGRRGGRGGGRGGRETSSRGGSSTAAIGDSTPAENTPTPLSSLPNGDQQRASKADATLNEESDTKASSISFREGSPSKASETTAVNTDTASINPREEYPTKPENMPNGHQRHLSNDQSQSGATSGTVRGSGSRGRGRRGDVGASGLERRRDNEVVAAIGEDSYTRPHTRRESVTTATDESVDRGARQMSDERFVPSKHQGFDRRGGSHQAYTTRESRGRGGARGGRGGAHGYSSQHLPNQQYINGQPMMQPYGYPTSRSPPGWQADQQSPYYPPGQTQSSKNFRGGSSRAQSIPTDAAYIRYGQVYGGVQPQMSPLQTFMGNMYDPQHAAQTMSAVPSCYSPFADQYSLFSMVSMQL